MPDFTGVTHNWTAAANGDPSNSSNWSTGSVPDTGDTVVLSGTYGSGDMNTNLDYFATYDTDFYLWYVDETYTGNIGSVGNSISFIADKVVMKGTGKFYFKSDNVTGGSTTGLVIVNSTNFVDAMTVDSDNLIVALSVIKGKAIVAATCATLSYVYVDYDVRPNSDARLEITAVDSGVAKISNLYQGAGFVECDREVTTGIQNGGRWIQDVDKISSFRQGGGTMIYNTPSPDGLMLSLTGLAGTFDMTDTKDVKSISGYTPFKDHTMIRNESIHTITSIIDMTGDM